MAIIEWYDAETSSVRKARFQGEQPEHVTEALHRAKAYALLRDQGVTHESAKAQLDAEAESRRQARAREAEEHQ